MSAFDPVAFLASNQTEANEERPRIPPELYTAVIGDIDPAKGKSGTYSTGPNIGNPWGSISVPLRLQLSPEAQALGLPPEFTLTDNVFIDLTPSGTVDNSKGKNTRQLEYRKATGTNNPGEPFSWLGLIGRPIKVQVKHEMYQGRVIEKPGMILPA